MLLAAIQAQPTEAPTYAVLPLKASGGVTDGEAAVIGDRLRVELFREARVKLMEREQMESILTEQGFQRSGTCADEACLVEMGQLLGVRYMVTGSLGKLGSLLLMNFRVIDVQQGTIVAVVGKEIKGGLEGVVDELPSIALELTGAKARQPQREPTKRDEPRKERKRAKPDRGDAAEAEDEGRKVRFTLGTDMVLGFGSHGDGGPRLRLGMRLKRHYIGLTYSWAAGSMWADDDLVPYDEYADYEYVSMFGGGFVYGYEINIRDILLITPEATAGLWIEEADVQWDYYTGSYWSTDYNEDINVFLFGLGARAQVGYKYVFLNTQVMLLVGSGLKLLLCPGISVYF